MLQSETLRNYANLIQLTKADIEASVMRLHNRMQEVNNGWNDTQNQKFVAGFEPHMQNIRSLAALLERYTRFCIDNANHIDQNYNS